MNSAADSGQPIMDEAEIRLKDIPVPEYCRKYHRDLLKKVQDSFDASTKARKLGIDVSEYVEPKIAFDLADRVAKMHNIDIAERLRLLLSQTTKEKAALKIAEEIALGEYGSGDIQTRLDNAVRVSLAVVTEGVTVAPLQGISSVEIKTNSDRSEYLSISFAGPIRSAGGTEAALTMLIADHARKAAGLDRYKANSFDDETGRFVEELRIYEREVGNFQFKVSDEDVIACISTLPVELDGVDTDPVEVVGHKGMKRISTDRVRGGALRVMNDGLIGRSRKLLKLVETLKLDGWEWLKDLKGAIQTGTDDDAAHHRMSEVITGRPVLSMAKKVGGFRLRYGRCFNTGFATIGIHPVVPALLNNAIVVGTQIKMDVPGKASTIAIVDSIEPPLVRLHDGTLIRVSSVDEAEKIRSSVEKIIYIGDILISYGDFLENNAQLLPASYVEEIWALQLRSKLADPSNNETSRRLIQLAKEPFTTFPSTEEAFEISAKFGIPLHPRYSFYWDTISLENALLLKEKIGRSLAEGSASFPYDRELKETLESLGVLHSVKNESIIIDDIDQRISLAKQLSGPAEGAVQDAKDSIDFISRSCGVTVMPKFASSIAVRVGRPEKAAERKMKPPVHVLFPVGIKGGSTRDVLKACEGDSFYAEITNRFCAACKLPSLGTRCRNCGEPTPMKKTCNLCRQEIREDDGVCGRCGRDARGYSPMNYPMKEMLAKAQKKVGFVAQAPFKGVKSLMSANRAPEPLEKGILRQKHSLYAFKDGTIRFDATNEPLTHFKPSWVATSVEKLVQLGYVSDHQGKELTSPNQLIELLMQDVIIPVDTARHLLNTARFIDDEFTGLYGLEPFYKADSIDDLVGHLVIGLAPHTSVGIIGRIIGFTNSQVCLGSPVWHSAKRRDCDGDADSVMLLTDAFLNFSNEFLPDKIGGLMDAPLLVQPVVLPHEVQRQAHNIDIVSEYPVGYYELTWKQAKAGEVASAGMIDLVKNRIGTEQQFFDYAFTHYTESMTTKSQRSAYSILESMADKLKMQIDTAKLINAVDPDEVVSMVLTTHILPDIMGNMRSYSSQTFRCTSCGAKYRRMPLMGKCECGNELKQTVTRGSVEKYVGIATSMCDQFKINDYLRSRVESLAAELKLVFQEQKKEQSSLMEFMG